MRSISHILLGAAGVLAIATPALAQSPPSQPSPVRKPSDPPVVPSSDPTRPSTLDPSLDPTTPSAAFPTTMTPSSTDIPDPNAPGAPRDAAPLPPPVEPISSGGGTLVVADTRYEENNAMSYAWRDNRLASGIGISTILGGGVSGFTDKTMRNTTSDVGGLWDLRVTIGSHIPLALDISYIGTASNLRGLTGDRSGTLLGTTVEGALRYNILPHAPVTPYVFGGVGWTRYDVTETNVSLSDSGINDKDNLLEFPVGAGFAYRVAGFVADVRGTFRATRDQNLVLENATLNPTSDDFAKMHTWEASAAVGYEF